MGILGWMGAGCAIGVATVLTGGAALPALLGAVKVGVGAAAIGAGAAVGAGAGAAVGVHVNNVQSNMVTVRRSPEYRPQQNTPRIEVDHVRWNDAEMDTDEEEKMDSLFRLQRLIADVEKDEEEERARRRREEEERVSRQPFLVLCVLRCNDAKSQQATGGGCSSGGGGCSSGGGGGSSGGGGGGDGGDRDNNQTDSDKKEESEDEEDLRRGRRIKLRSHQPKKKRKMRREGYIRGMTANVRSLKRKTFRVYTLVDENQVDVACLQETFTNQNNAETSLSRASGPNFNYRYRNRKRRNGSTTARGGVATLYSKSVQVSESEDSSVETLDDIQVDTFEFVPTLVRHSIWNESVLVISLYRRPGQTEDEIDEFLWELKMLLDEAEQQGHNHIIVTGDFNIHVNKDTPASRMFRCFLKKNVLKQHVNESTHKDGNTLDLVITRNVQIADVQVGEKKISDHKPVFFNFRPDLPSEEEEEEEEQPL